MRTRYGKTGWLCAGIVMVLCLAFLLPQMNLFARGKIDTEKPCSLTVKIDSLKSEADHVDWEDLKNAKDGIEVYLYRIAATDSFGGFDPAEDFKKAVEKDIASGTYPISWKLEELNRSIFNEDVKAADWEALAHYAAKFYNLPVSEKTGEDGTEETLGELVIPKEEDLPEPEKKITIDTKAFQETETPFGRADDMKQGLYLVWVKPVAAPKCEYTFLPYLVSLPNNEYGQTPDASDSWIYDVTVGLKPQQRVRYLNLEIVKSLTTYNESLGEAMFVFQVEAVKTDKDAEGKETSKVVYSDMLGMNFKEPGQQSVLVKKIPAGTKVTVKEVYTGASYKLTGWGGETWNPASEVFTGEADNPTIEITALLGASGEVNGGIDEDGVETAAKITFTNDYDETTTFGTGIVNHFTYSEEDKKWVGVQIVGGDHKEEAANE